MSIKDIIGRGTKRTFRPVSAEGHLVKVTGMDVRSKHTPTSQLFTHFQKPTHGFSVKQVIGTSPTDRQKFARDMVTYRQQVAKQRQLEAEQKKLAEQLGQAYQETVRYQARQVQSIDDLTKEKQRLQDIYKDTKQAYDQLQVELKRQQEASRQVARSSRSSGGRSLLPRSRIQVYTPQRTSTPTTRMITSNIQMSSSGTGRGAKLQFVRK